MVMIKNTQKKQIALSSVKHPSIFTLEVATSCNNACALCANAEVEIGRKGHFVSRYEAIIDKIAPYAQIIRVSGGEPTLHPDFPAIIEKIEESNIPHALLTNARWTKHKPEAIIDLYKNTKNFAGMLVSLHGANKHSHEAFVGIPQAFDETCGNIEFAASSGLTVYTNCVLTKFSCEEIEAVIDLSLGLGAKYIVFNRLIAPTTDTLHPTPAQLMKAIEQIEKLRKSGTPCRIGNSIPPCFATTSHPQSKGGHELCYISPTGGMRPENYYSGKYWGDILKDDLLTVWTTQNNQRAQLPENCINCAAASICRGGLLYGDAPTDSLMRNPLPQSWEPGEEDDSKRYIPYLALTSD